MDDEESWDLINSYYCIGGTFEQWNASDEDGARSALQLVKQLGIGQMVLDMALESVWTALRREIVPVFWRTVCTPSANESDTGLLTRFHDALQLLQNSVVVLGPLILRCEEVCRECGVQYKFSRTGCTLEEEMMSQLRATLHSQMPEAAPRTLKDVYAVAFRIYGQLQLTPADKPSEDSYTDTSVTECPGCLRLQSSCQCANLATTFNDINRLTWSVGVAYELCSVVAAVQLVRSVHQKVQYVCALPHDIHRLHTLQREWLKPAALGWVSVLSTPCSPAPGTSDPLYRTCQATLTRSFLNTRVNNLFSIVMEWPESRPAIEDLRTCLQHVNAHQHLVRTLRNSIQTRMLHPGVNTVEVLDAYVAIIKALRVLDPRGVVLDLVTEPVRTYLRGRRDFVRYIVSCLTDGGSLELTEELTDGVEGEAAEEGPGQEEEWRKWEPDTIYARNVAKNKIPSDSSSDLISMLVEIYGSKDMFISEYRALFADRLLNKLDCTKQSVELETKHLEQIKKRFGSSSSYISKIEVMIRDMNVSRSVNNAVLEHDSDTNVAVACMIVSGLFWPAFKEENIEVPEQVLGYIKHYDELFGKLKPNKKLSWKPHLGQVELEVELESRTLSLKVSPSQAIVLMAFEKRPRMSLQELTYETKTLVSTARKLVAYWVGQGVLREVGTDEYEVCEKNEAVTSEPQTLPPPQEDELESAMAPAEVQRGEELEVLWSYILGMLTNLDSLPLDRIHSMLKMFVEESVEVTAEELRALLDQKVTQHKLLLVHGQYKLNKN